MEDYVQHINITDLHLDTDDKGNTYRVTAHYSIRVEGNGIRENGNGTIELTGEEYKGNESVENILNLIRSKRSTIRSA